MGRTKAVVGDIYHPIFKDMVKYTDDLEWKSMLENMANNIFLPYYSYSNNNLLFRQGKKVDKERLSTDAKEAFSQVQAFIRKSNFKTTEELDARTNKLDIRLKKGWKAVKSENMQKIYLHEFVDRYVKEHKLPKLAEARLREEIFINAIEKRYNNKCIDFVDGHICRLNEYMLKM